MEIRPLLANEAESAASLHRRAGALIPGYDTSLHSEAEFVAFYRDVVMPSSTIWGAFEAGALLGYIAVRPGWIDHLYVEPNRHRRGVGSALLRFVMRDAEALRLYTFQSNATARAFYERHGFVIEDLSDGARNEEKMPDMTYRWLRAPSA